MLQVLLADDDPEILALYRHALAAHSIGVRATATSGREAVARFREHRADLDVVVLDHRMPDMTGLEAGREILSLDPSAVVLMASADDAVREEAMAIGIRSFKKKPFTLHRLVNNVRKHASRRTAASGPNDVAGGLDHGADRVSPGAPAEAARAARRRYLSRHQHLWPRLEEEIE